MNDKSIVTRSQRPIQAKRTTQNKKVVPIIPNGKNFVSKIPVPMPTKKLQARGVKHVTKKEVTKKRTYVLDTNVLMHDPACLFHFKEHDVVVPFMVLEELDNHKKGHDDKNRNARQACRTIESLFENENTAISSGISLEKISSGEATGKISVLSEMTFEKGTKPDNVILEAVKRLKTATLDRDVVLVSKDINMRLKARTMGLLVEDYKTDTTEAKDGDYIHPGFSVMPNDFWETHATDLEAKQTKGATEYTIHGKDAKNLRINQFVITDKETKAKPFIARVIKKNGNSAVLRTAENYFTHDTYKIKARNDEQNFALNLLMNPEIHLVSLAGIAGTGKTMLALAAGLEQTFERNIYSEILFTRATVAVGDEIGFLPGDEQEKMAPWLGALYDNLDVLTGANNPDKDSKHGNEWGKSATDAFIRSKIKICSMSFIRGRTFVNKYIIIDEVQNLTPKQIKTLVTRAGEGTKMIFMGNLAQIDTPYLTEGSCGLTHLANNFHDWERSGHITLVKGERSELADRANEVL